MHRISFLLAYLACTSHGRLAHARVAETSPDRESPAKWQASETSPRDASKVFVGLLLQSSPPAAFHSCPLGVCLQAGQLDSMRQARPNRRSLAPMLQEEEQEEIREVEEDEDELQPFVGAWCYELRGKPSEYRLSIEDGKLFYTETLSPKTTLEGKLDLVYYDSDGKWREGKVQLGTIRVRLMRNGRMMSNFAFEEKDDVWGTTIIATKRALPKALENLGVKFADDKIPYDFQPAVILKKTENTYLFNWANSDEEFRNNFLSLYAFLLCFLGLPIFYYGDPTGNPDFINVFRDANALVFALMLAAVLKLRGGWGLVSDVLKNEEIYYELQSSFLVDNYVPKTIQKEPDELYRDRLIQQQQVRPIIKRANNAIIALSVSLSALGAVYKFR